MFPEMRRTIELPHLITHLHACPKPRALQGNFFIAQASHEPIVWHIRFRLRNVYLLRKPAPHEERPGQQRTCIHQRKERDNLPERVAWAR